MYGAIRVTFVIGNLTVPVPELRTAGKVVTDGEDAGSSEFVVAASVGDEEA